MGHVTCVCFFASGSRWAMEARHVRRIDSAVTQPRYTTLEQLMFSQPSHSSRWLTLHDAQGAWQLGITGDSEIIHLPSTAIHPLPPLLAARAPHPALCGVALDEPTFTLLLNGERLSPLKASTYQP